MTLGRATTLLALLSAGLFAALAILAGTTLQPDGQPVFDARALGYGLTEAREYLGALEPDQRMSYLGPYRWLDTAFPLVFTCFLAAMFWRVSAGWKAGTRLLLLLMPGSYLVMDLAENALVAELLVTPLSDLRAGAVVLASRFTVTKYVTLTISVLALAALGVMRRGRR